MHAHSEEWIWNANVMNSHVMAIQMLDVIPMNKNTFQWGYDDLPFADKTKHLGVWINHDLSWNEHISQVKKKGWLKLNKDPPKKQKKTKKKPKKNKKKKGGGGGGGESTPACKTTYNSHKDHPHIDICH